MMLDCGSRQKLENPMCSEANCIDRLDLLNDKAGLGSMRKGLVPGQNQYVQACYTHAIYTD